MQFSILDQPVGTTVGARLKFHLTEAASGKYQAAWLVAAFAKRAGVGRITSEITNARANGCKVTAIVGIDHGGTSREGLQILLDTCDELFVCHSTNQQVTFHVKAYIFEGNAHATLISGSSNLTCGGLFTNSELCIETDFDLPKDSTLYGPATQWLVTLQDTANPCVVKVDQSNIAALQALLPSEIGSFTTSSPTGGTAGGLNAGSMFGSGPFTPPPALTSTGTGQSGSASSHASAAALTLGGANTGAAATQAITLQRGWKKLSKFDVHTTQSPGSIIIPKDLWALFPAFQTTVITPAAVSQREANFLARFIDGATQKLGDRRLIEYPPAPGHKRTNTERRLAFHDNTINPNGLTAGDVLLFEPLSGDPNGAFMNITRILPGHPLYGTLPGINKSRGAQGLLP